MDGKTSAFLIPSQSSHLYDIILIQDPQLSHNQQISDATQETNTEMSRGS